VLPVKYPTIPSSLIGGPLGISVPSPNEFAALLESADKVDFWLSPAGVLKLAPISHCATAYGIARSTDPSFNGKRHSPGYTVAKRGWLRGAWDSDTLWLGAYDLPVVRLNKVQKQCVEDMAVKHRARIVLADPKSVHRERILCDYRATRPV
jgi:hypothetical protein